ncbi:class I SAM-dependent methyltransferase [Pigmentiphaga soli]|uniref:Class I SAM-dependent methyltransferase n=1 Tax=Pigmentiphaga soli TaxID=1007095 RepID=A0ABP8HN86_9BURK
MRHSFSPVRRAMILAALAGAAPLGAAGAAPAAEVPSLDAVIAGPQRSAANKARDVYRHPRQTLQFFGLQPGQTVIEIAPGDGWYTEILAPYLRDRGKLYAAHYEPGGANAERARSRARYEAKLRQDPDVYGKVTVGTLPVKAFTDIHPPGGADMVLTFRNIHNWMKDGHFDDTLRAFYAVLKSGGVLGVEEHRARPGTSLAQMIASGYVTEDYVIEHARAAGFQLAARSEINANPRDTKDYPQGVWTLPPTLREGDKDRAKYLAIGESDRMTLRFVKPAAAR